MKSFFFILLTSSLFSDSFCSLDSQIMNRSIYSVGDTISLEDQAILFPVCNGSEEYSTGDSFSFADLNGGLNGEDYKITLISMNATW